MTFPNWYTLEKIERSGHKKYLMSNAMVLAASRKVSRPKATASLSLSRLLFALSIVSLLLATVLYFSDARPMADSAALQASPRSHFPTPLITSSSPVVFITPGNFPLMTVGSTFTVQIQVQNMDLFNGWDIEVFAPLVTLNATSLSITGNDFEVNASSGSAFEIVHCINNKGTGCSPTNGDGPGIVHSAYANTASLTGNGLLFTVIYQVTGNPNAVNVPIALKNDGISSPNTGTPVAHASVWVYYAVPAFTIAGGGPPRHD